MNKLNIYCKNNDHSFLPETIPSGMHHDKIVNDCIKFESLWATAQKPVPCGNMYLNEL